MGEPVRIALRLAYLGQGFAGWQRQRNGRTVQGEVEQALARLYRQPVTLIGAGRTDAGVHAAGQMAHYDSPRSLPTPSIRAALNTLLPPEVRILGARRVSATFHARRSALAKVYRYRLAWGPPLTPWEAQRRVLLPGHPDLEALRDAAAVVAGAHDFAAFARSGHSGTGRLGTVRTLSEIVVRPRGRRLDLIFVGDGFLRGMARRLTGSLLQVGRRAQAAQWIAALLADPGTRPPAPTAPAHGLTLERVLY